MGNCAFPTSASDAPFPVRESEDTAFGRLHFTAGCSLVDQDGGLYVLQLIRFIFRKEVDDVRLAVQRLGEMSAGEFAAFENLVLVGYSR